MKKETRRVTIAILGESREIEVERVGPGHAWYAKSPILCRFRSGKKLHAKRYPIVTENSRGQFLFPAQSIHGLLNAIPVAFADDGQLHSNSEWTG